MTRFLQTPHSGPRRRRRSNLSVPGRPAILWLALLWIVAAAPIRAQLEEDKDEDPDGAIPIAVPERQDPVSFNRELLPIFQAKCLACHSKSLALGNVVLENRQLILSGDRAEPLVVPGDGADSLLLQVAAHLRQPFMPPEGNAAEAAPLTPEELGLLKLWIDQGARQSSTTSLLPRLKWKAIPGALNPVYSATISHDGNYAACGRSNRIFVYHLASGQLAARLIDPSLNQGDLYGEPGVSHRDMVQSLAFSPKGGLLVSGGYRILKFWRLQTPVQTPNPTEPGQGKQESSWVLERVVGSAEDPGQFLGRVTALAFSPDGQLLATGSGDPSRSGELKIWNAQNGTLVGAVPDAHSDTILGLEFSPDGRYLATASTDRFAKVFEVESRQLAKTFEGHTHHVLDVAWKADGKVLATCGADGDIKLWDFETGEQKQTISGYEKEITSLSFIADSDRLLISSGDPVVRLGERRLGGVSSFVHVSAVSRDGRTVVAGDQAGRLLVWRSPEVQPRFVLEPEAEPTVGPSGK